MTPNWPAIQADFPILQRRIHGKRLVYLDSAASSQKPNQVIDAISDFYRHHYANIHRGVYTLSAESTEQWDLARARVARFINASTPEAIVFVRNTTEAINLVAHGWARQAIQPGDEIVVTALEHHANLVPWQRVCHEREAILRHIPVTDAGELDLAAATALINPRTRLVSFAHVSNALGTINPVAEITALARRVGANVLIDAAQSVPHMPVDVQALDCDLLAFSAHKMLGPTGIGVLYAKPEILATMEPFLTGGDMIDEVFLDRATWAPAPQRFEAGTPDIAGAVGLTAAIDYLETIGLAAIRDHERDLTAYALDRLATVPDLTILGPLDPDRRGGAISFDFAGCHPHDVGTILDFEGIAVRTGHHCAQPLMRRFGLAGTTRASLYLYNTPADVDALVAGLAKVRATLGRRPASHQRPGIPTSRISG